MNDNRESNNIVAIVGRPNVGKSSLFNRLTGRRTAIEDRESGVTRDRLYGRADWWGRELMIIDTGGIIFGDDDPMEGHIRRQVEIAIDEAAVIIMLVDARQGVTYMDRDIASYLRKSGKPAVLAANKVDPGYDVGEAYSFYELGLGEPFPVSAVHGLGTGDLLDKVLEVLPAEDGEELPDTESIRVAVAGRPNVGKSSLINMIIGKDRVIVSDMAGTTRDAIDVTLEHNNCRIVMVDTAGIRRKSRVKGAVEYYSVLRAMKAIKRADVVLLILDGETGLTEQDARLVGMSHEAGKALIFVLNKWDLVSVGEEKGKDRAYKYRQEITDTFSFAAYAPVLITSALTGRGINKILDKVQHVHLEWQKRIPTGILNELLSDALAVNPPPSKSKIRSTKFYYVTQPKEKPPTFVFFVNDPELVHFSYIRYLENRIREAFGYEGTPLVLKLRKKS